MSRLPAPIGGAGRDADGAPDEPQTPQTSGAPRARPQARVAAPAADYEEAAAANRAAVDAAPLATRVAMRRRILERLQREGKERDQREAAQRAAEMPARLAAVPRMPRKLRPKPQPRYNIGPGKFYADQAAFDNDLDAWLEEREDRRELMEERRRAQESARKFRDHVGPLKPAPLTEADLPPVPPRLERDATEAERAERNAIMTKRARVLKSRRPRMRTRDVRVVVPEGVAPGQSFAITTPDGGKHTLICPPHSFLGPGQTYLAVLKVRA